MRLHLDPFSAEAFAPFGRTITRPATGEAANLKALIGEGRPESRFCAQLDTHPAKALPIHGPKMERHEHSEQLFVPLDPNARYVIAAALPGADGAPDLASLRGFLVEGGLGICYARGVWHLPITILDRPTTFLMQMTQIGDPAIDTSWAVLAEPIEVLAP